MRYEAFVLGFYTFAHVQKKTFSSTISESAVMQHRRITNEGATKEVGLGCTRLKFLIQFVKLFPSTTTMVTSCS